MLGVGVRRIGWQLSREESNEDVVRLCFCDAKISGSVDVPQERNKQAVGKLYLPIFYSEKQLRWSGKDGFDEDNIDIKKGSDATSGQDISLLSR